MNHAWMVLEWTLGLQMSNVGLRGSKEGSRVLPEGSAGSGDCSAMLGDCSEILEKCSEILSLGLGIWTLDKQSEAWTSNLGLGTDCRGLWLRYLGLGQVIGGLDE